MTKDEQIASVEYSVLKHAYKNKNITDTCRIFNLSRTVYYKWLKRFNQFGYPGLRDKEKSKPRLPNQIKPDKEEIILNYILAYHTQEPRRITSELNQQGVKISEPGVYHNLRRRGLERCLDWLFDAQEHLDNPIITERYLREVEKKKENHIKAYFPGYLFYQDTFYVVTIKGLGRIYQQAGINTSALRKSILIRRPKLPLIL